MKTFLVWFSRTDRFAVKIKAETAIEAFQTAMDNVDDLEPFEYREGDDEIESFQNVEVIAEPNKAK